MVGLYEIIHEPRVKKQLKKLQKKAKVRYENILEKLTELEVDPKNDTVELRDPVFDKLWRAKTDDDRIFFQICEDCRADPSLLELRQCSDCESTPEKGIKIFEIHPVRTAYNGHRRR